MIHIFLTNIFRTSNILIKHLFVYLPFGLDSNSGNDERCFFILISCGFRGFVIYIFQFAIFVRRGFVVALWSKALVV